MNPFSHKISSKPSKDIGALVAAAVHIGGCSYQWECSEPALSPYCENYADKGPAIVGFVAYPQSVPAGNDVTFFAEIDSAFVLEEVTASFPDYENIESLTLTLADDSSFLLLYTAMMNTSPFSTQYVQVTVDATDVNMVSAQYPITTYFEIK